MAIVAVFIPLVLLAVLVVLGRYEELMLPPLDDEPDPPETPALAGQPAPGGRPAAPRSPAEQGTRHV